MKQDFQDEIIYSIKDCIAEDSAKKIKPSIINSKKNILLHPKISK